MNLSGARPDPARDPEEPPPILGSWRRLYLAVLGWLAILILAFFWFAREWSA
jgi:hypothetical protein